MGFGEAGGEEGFGAGVVGRGVVGVRFRDVLVGLG